MGKQIDENKYRYGITSDDLGEHEMQIGNITVWIETTAEGVKVGLYPNELEASMDSASLTFEEADDAMKEAAAEEEDLGGGFFPAIMIGWSESERGWGQRPDGVSLHLTQKDADAYIESFCEEEKKLNPSGETPECYERPDSNHGSMIAVSKSILKRIKDSDNGIRMYDEYSKARSAGKIKTERDL